jgi:hypothetical protein
MWPSRLTNTIEARARPPASRGEPCRGSRPPTVYKCETTFARLPLRGIPIYTLRIYVGRTHVCYNRFPPHVYSNIFVQFSTACLTVWLCMPPPQSKNSHLRGHRLSDGKLIVWERLLFCLACYHPEVVF